MSLRISPTTGKILTTSSGKLAGCGGGGGIGDCETFTPPASITVSFSDLSVSTEDVFVRNDPDAPINCNSIRGTASIPTLSLKLSSVFPGAGGVVWAAYRYEWRKSVSKTCRYTVEGVANEYSYEVYFEYIDCEVSISCNGVVTVTARAWYNSFYRQAPNAPQQTGWSAAFYPLSLGTLVASTASVEGFVGEASPDFYLAATVVASNATLSSNSHSGDVGPGVGSPCGIVTQYCIDGDSPGEDLGNETIEGETEFGSDAPNIKHVFYINGPCPCGPMQSLGFVVITEAAYPGDSDGPWTYNSAACRWEYTRYTSNGVILGQPDPPAASPACMFLSFYVEGVGGKSVVLIRTGGCQYNYESGGSVFQILISGAVVSVSGTWLVEEEFNCRFDFFYSFETTCSACDPYLNNQAVNIVGSGGEEPCSAFTVGDLSIGPISC